MTPIGFYRYITSGCPLMFGQKAFYDWRTLWMPTINPMLKNRKKWQLQILIDTIDGSKQWINADIREINIRGGITTSFKDCRV